MDSPKGLDYGPWRTLGLRLQIFQRSMTVTDYRQLEERFFMNLRLERRPVAITSMGVTPRNVLKFSGTVPSGCTFWRLASEGRTFYTVASDH